MNQQPGMGRILAEVALFAFLGPFFAVIWLVAGMTLGFWGKPDGAGLLASFASIAVMTPFALMMGLLPAAVAGVQFAVLRHVFWGARYPAYWLCALLGGGAGLTAMGGLIALTANKSGVFLSLMPVFAGAMCAIVIRILWAGTASEHLKP